MLYFSSKTTHQPLLINNLQGWHNKLSLAGYDPWWDSQCDIASVNEEEDRIVWLAQLPFTWIKSRVIVATKKSRLLEIYTLVIVTLLMLIWSTYHLMLINLLNTSLIQRKLPHPFLVKIHSLDSHHINDDHFTYMIIPTSYFYQI